MVSAEEFRKRGREALRSHWPLSIGVGFVASFFGVSALSNTPVIMFNQLAESYEGLLPVWFPSLVIFLVIWALISFIWGGATHLGYATFNLRLVDGQEASFDHIFSHYNRLGKGFLMEFLTGLCILLCTLLLIIPGIIVYYSYAMTPYILAENPNLTASQAIKASSALMHGQKWRLFCLELSFIGWHFLSILTLCIGLLWLTPYVEASRAAFYREISRKETLASDGDLAETSVC